MVSKKGSTASNVSSKAVAPCVQQNLFHFYQKQPKVKGREKAADLSVTKEVVSRFSGMSAAKSVLLEEDMHSRSEQDQSIAMTVDMDCAEASKDSQSLSMRFRECIDGALAVSLALPNSIDDRPTSPRLKVADSGPSKKVMRKKPFPIFEKSHAASKPSPIVVDDTNPASQGRLSSDTFSYQQQPAKENKLLASPDVIDLTDSLLFPRPDTTTSAGKDSIVVDDDRPSGKRSLFGSREAPIELGSSPPESRPAEVLHQSFARNTTKREKTTQTGPTDLVKRVSREMQTPWPDAVNQHSSGPQTISRTTEPIMFGNHQRTSTSAWSTVPPNLRFLVNSENNIPGFPGIHGSAIKPHVPTPVKDSAVASFLPDAHRKHPGIVRLYNEAADSGKVGIKEDAQMWSQKWRPRRAAEVLGNEDNALYLKAWLQALAIRVDDEPQAAGINAEGRSALDHGSRVTKRPTVVRTVNKKRGRKRRKLASDDGSSLDGWIFDDYETRESENDLVDRISPVTGTNVSPLRHARNMGTVDNANIHDSSHSPEFSTLTNTILLAGPSGSGKTSTIYACAEELGWEIFEVYPGIGKRSGGNISSLIGDVGKNHLVGRRGVGGTYANCSTNRPGFGFLSVGGGREDVAHAEDDRRAIRQSAILLEEVDILFKDDANFWPTLVNIIKSSHRPVFMTCNDISLIPQDDLPLQTCLHFQPCPPPLAVSFLQCVCLAEGHPVSRKQLEDAYARTFNPISCDVPEEPTVPFPSQAPAAFDLRRTINNLQFWCSQDSAVGGDVTAWQREMSTMEAEINTSSWTEILADWSRAPGLRCKSFLEDPTPQNIDIFRIGKHADNVSFIDGYLEQRPSDIMEALAIDRYESSGDDETGHALLDKPAVDGRATGLAFYNRDRDMAEEALTLSRHVLECSGGGPRVRNSLRGRKRGTTRHLDSRSLAGARVANQMQAVSFLDDVISLAGPLLPRPAAVLEYTPYVRQMILADDAQEAEAAAGATYERRGRPTRSRWLKGDYTRYLSISADGLEAARTLLL